MPYILACFSSDFILEFYIVYNCLNAKSDGYFLYENRFNIQLHTMLWAISWETLPL